MSNPVERYVKSMSAKFGYFATWLPNEPLELGDVGTLDGKLFRRETSLASLGIELEARDDGPPADWEHSSGSGLRVDLRGAGGAAGTGGGAVVEFSEEGAFLFVARRVLVRGIDDLARLGRAVVEAERRGAWKARWTLIDSIVEAKSATILISSSSSSRLELSAQTPLRSLQSLADADAGVAVATQQGDITRFVATRGVRPLFRLSRLKRPFFGGASELGPILRSAYPLEEVHFETEPDGAWPDLGRHGA